MSKRKTRLIMADDHAMFRKAMRVYLDRQADMRVVGEAGTGADTLRQLESGNADMLLLDISMPDMAGTHVAREALRRWPELAIIVLTMHSEGFYARDLIRLGVRAFVLKRSSGEVLLEAIRAVRDGEVYWDRSVLEDAVSTFAGIPRRHERQTGAEDLTPREREVCRLLAYGHTNAEIAEQLSISIRTAQSHRQNILNKLNLRSRAEIVAFAMRTGIFTPHELPG